jgi:excisionase family DNA binding protein
MAYYALFCYFAMMGLEYANAPARQRFGSATTTAAFDQELLAVPRLMSAEQVAELLGMDVEWVWKMSRRGEIPTVTLGRFRRYRREAILRWLEAIESKPSR